VRIEAILWSATALYFALIGALYLVLSGDPAGATILLVGAPFGGLIAGWLWHSTTRISIAADRGDSDAADETGVVGSYTTDSIRPLALAVGFVAAWLGLVIGLWLTGTALALMASQAALIVRDADR
jgi:hypothetical protein